MAINISIFTTRSGVSGTDGNAPAIPGVAVSSTNTFYSDCWSGNNGDGESISLFWSGTPSGTFTLWMTDILNPGLADDTDWIQDTSFSPTNPSGSAGKMRDDAGNAKAFRKRIKYVNSSGSGTIKGYVTAPKWD